MVGVLFIIYTTIRVHPCSVLCLLLFQLLKRIYARCVANCLFKFYSAFRRASYLYNNYGAILFSSLLIIYTTIIAHFCSVPC